MKQILISLSLAIIISSSAFSQIQIDSIGNVGIGTATPSTKLDVSGIITATGGTSTNWNNAFVVDTITTVDDTPTTISIIGTSSDAAYIIETHVISYRTDISGEAAGFIFRTVWINNAGTVSQVSNDDLTSWRTGAGASAWQVDAIVSGTNVLIEVTGKFVTTINWKASSRITSIN
jgi:hypothetical protein